MPAIDFPSHPPKISVVTPTYNQGQFIGETIESVLTQNYPNLEYIIIDGGSTDETLSVIDPYQEQLHYFISEPDEGQSNALNKGFQQATGDILCWLNSDDQFAPDALWSIAVAFATSDADMVAGICEIYESGELVHRHMTSCGNGMLPLQDILDLDNGWNAGQFFYQPEVSFSRNLWDRAGGHVREDYFYSMDYELWCRFAGAGAVLKTIGVPIAHFRSHADQKTADESAFKKELVIARDTFCRDNDIQFEGSKRPPVNWTKKLKIAMVNDLGFHYGAGIAQLRIAAAFEMAGHEVKQFRLIDSKDQSDYQDVETAVGRFAPDMVVWGNLHGVEKISVALVDRLQAKFPGYWLAHDFWLFSGRCAYAADCQQYLSGCDAGCPTQEQYPVIDPKDIAPAWQAKRAFLSSAANFTLLANSDWALQRVQDTLGHFSNQVGTARISLGCPRQTFYPMDKKECRQRLGINPDSFVIAFSVSSLSEGRKGGSYLIQALQDIGEPDITLVVMGRVDVPLSMNAANLVELGYLKDKKKLVTALNAADLYVGPSTEESFGQVFVEAALCGTASLGFDVTGVKSAIKQGITGRRVAEISTKSLKEGILEFYENRELLDRIRTLAPIYARNEFSLEASYASIFAVLNVQGKIDEWGVAHKIAFSESSDLIESQSLGWFGLSLRGKVNYVARKIPLEVADRLPTRLRRAIGSLLPLRFKRWLLGSP